MKINRKVCWMITLGFHWWKHYPGEKRYVRCCLCGRLPKSMWNTLRKLKNITKDWGLACVEDICIAIPFERAKK